jgi:ABC-2 type transport system ATP-binding protein
MIDVARISKRFGAVTALQNVDLHVPRGTVTGLLGHNGAGKTTLVNVLATLVQPTAGTARVGGCDVVREAKHVRRLIGLSGQFATVDEQLSGRENLILIARLLGAGRRTARTHADGLLELLDLRGAAGRLVRTYSGGMRRRLDLAASLVGRPPIVFLDEPTTGLDPASRLNLWRIVQRLVAQGTTVLLTTQQLDEADRLADSITLLGEGRVVAAGTPAELKRRFGERTATVRLALEPERDRALHAFRGLGLRPRAEGITVSVPVATSGEVAAVFAAAERLDIDAQDLTLTEPDLHDVYDALMPAAGGARWP